MKPERALIAERPVAEHTPLLLRRSGATAPADLLPALARAADKLARALPGALAPLLGGKAPAIAAQAAREAAAGALTAQLGPLAANLLLAVGPHSVPLLASLDASAVLRIVDRVFGGKGEAASPLPKAFPMSAELMIERIERLVMAAIADALGLAEPDAVRPIRRDGSLERLGAFAEDAPLAIQTLTVTEGDTAWDIVLALPLSALPQLVEERKHAAPRPATGLRAGPEDAPFCDVPLTLCAIVVDMAVPMAALRDLRPGAVIPVSVARSVPLRIGAKTVAHGAIGAVDDQVAIQVTQAF